MHNLSALAHAAKAAANLRPSDVSAYFDQIQVWLQQPLNNSELRPLRQQCGDLHHHNEPALWDRHGRWRQRLQLYRPSAATFLWLSQRRGLHLNKVELALDWTWHDAEQNETASQLVRRYWVKPRHGKQQVILNDETLYLAQRKARNVPLTYGDGPSRITGKPHCVHIEWRITGIEALQRAKINSVMDLLGFDHRRSWQHWLELYVVNLRKAGHGFSHLDADDDGNDALDLAEALVEEFSQILSPLRQRIEIVRNDGHRGACTMLANVLWEHADMIIRLADELLPVEELLPPDDLEAA